MQARKWLGHWGWAQQLPLKTGWYTETPMYSNLRAQAEFAWQGYCEEYGEGINYEIINAVDHALDELELIEPSQKLVLEMIYGQRKSVRSIAHNALEIFGVFCPKSNVHRLKKAGEEWMQHNLVRYHKYTGQKNHLIGLKRTKKK